MCSFSMFQYHFFIIERTQNPLPFVLGEQLENGNFQESQKSDLQLIIMDDHSAA